MQPWHFVAIKDAVIKTDIRQAAEAEERELYEHRASDEWLSTLVPLGTNADKPFLETAPWLIAVFSRKYTLDENGTKRKHYYTPESVGIATGMWQSHSVIFPPVW
jgi:iodotyrosine deiodinase